ncbi:hypothetical protein HMPREF9341_00209 [Cutibacterium acnes HL103PA1]|nr:hypothetical protein HMPREF9341_00209 [Cutibacterium acnes HL103PA1]
MKPSKSLVMRDSNISSDALVNLHPDSTPPQRESFKRDATLA